MDFVPILLPTGFARAFGCVAENPSHPHPSGPLGVQVRQNLSVLNDGLSPLEGEGSIALLF
jgi:hypothetical protein